MIEEGQAIWLAFLNGELDILGRHPGEFHRRGARQRQAPARARRQGHAARGAPAAEHPFAYFNMEDPTVGGYTPEKIALRRAIGMGYNVGEFIRVILKGRGVPAMGPLPPDIVGYDPKLKTSAQLYDPAAARALLDRFGYKDRDGDGYREMPDGKPLVLERWSPPRSIDRLEDEQWKKNMDAIGLRIVFSKDRIQDLRKMARQGKLPMRTDGWNADYPDAENFMQLLYGAASARRTMRDSACPSSTSSTRPRAALPDSPERTALFDKMTEIVARLRAVAADGASDRGSPHPAVGAGTTSPIRCARSSGGTSTSIRRNVPDYPNSGISVGSGLPGEPSVEVRLAEVAHRLARLASSRCRRAAAARRCPSRAAAPGCWARRRTRRVRRALIAPSCSACDERRLVDDRAARDVDERALLAERREHFGIDDVLRRGAAGARDDQEVRRRRERLQVGDELVRDVLRLAPGVGDLHPHRREPLRDRLADAAEAEDAGRLAAELGRELRRRASASRPRARSGWRARSRGRSSAPARPRRRRRRRSARRACSSP